MKKELLAENKSQKMLIGVMVALFFMLVACIISTGKHVPAEKGLTLWTPDRVQKPGD